VPLRGKTASSSDSLSIKPEIRPVGSLVAVTPLASNLLGHCQRPLRLDSALVENP